MDWERLAATIRRRRLTLDRSQEDVGRLARLTPVTVSRAENGHPMSSRTLWKLDRGLDWAPGTAEQVAQGGEPVDLDKPATPGDYADPEERDLWHALPAQMTDARKDELVVEFRQLRAADELERRRRAASKRTRKRAT